MTKNNNQVNVSEIRSKGFMYVQQLAQLPVADIAALKQRLNNLNAKRWAMIVHDADVDDQGQDVEPHVHAMIEFKNQTRLSTIANKIGDDPERFENMTKQNKHGKNGIINGFSYLIHATKNARDKHQYDPSEVMVSRGFNYQKLLNDSVDKTAVYREGDELLEGFANGKMRLSVAQQALLKLGYQVYTALIDQLNKLAPAAADLRAKKWQDEKSESGKPLEAYWFHANEGGTGKTKLAVEYAMSLANGDKSDVFISGGSNDPFQGYDGQSVIVLDEFRPDMYKFQDLLRVLDPFGTDAMTTARYRNAHLTADYIIITSPMSPREFYDGSKIDHEKENFYQLARRIKGDMRFTYDHIYTQQYNREIDDFEDSGRPRVNNYAEKETQTGTVSIWKILNTVSK